MRCIGGFGNLLLWILSFGFLLSQGLQGFVHELPQKCKLTATQKLWILEAPKIHAVATHIFPLQVGCD